MRPFLMWSGFGLAALASGKLALNPRWPLSLHILGFASGIMIPIVGTRAMRPPIEVIDSPSRPAPSGGRLTSQGSAHARFQRALATRNLFQAELALREMRTPSLLIVLDYLEVLADVRPDKFDRAAVRWHGRLELESAVLTIAESQLALAALGSLRAGDKSAAEILRQLLRRMRPTLVQRVR
jgi:hypothetical protein